KAPAVGWGSGRTIAELGGAFALLAAFVVNERRAKNPLAPLSIFRVNGLGYADATQLIAFAGFLAMFFFLTLYLQNVPGYSAIYSALATSRTTHLLADHASPAQALTSGFQRGLLAGSIFILAAAVIAFRATNTSGEQPGPLAEVPETAPA